MRKRAAGKTKSITTSRVPLQSGLYIWPGTLRKIIDVEMEIQAIASKSMRVIPKHVSSGDWVIGLGMVLVANCW